MYATRDDVIARMDRPLESSDYPRVDALLQDTGAALNAKYPGDQMATLVSDYPDLLVSAQARAVARILSTPVGPVRENQLGDARVMYYNDGTAPLLIAHETADLDGAIGEGAGGGLKSLQMTSSTQPEPGYSTNAMPSFTTPNTRWV